MKRSAKVAAADGSGQKYGTLSTTTSRVEGADRRKLGISIKISIILLSVLLLLVALTVVILINFYAHRDTGATLGAQVQVQTVDNVELKVLDVVRQPHAEALREHFYLTKGVVDLEPDAENDNLPTSMIRYQAKVMETRPFLGAIYAVNADGLIGFYRAGSDTEFITLTSWDPFLENALIFAPVDEDGNGMYEYGETIPYDRSAEDWINFAFTVTSPLWSPIYTVPSEAGVLFVSAYHPIVNETTGETTAFVGVDLTTTQLDRFLSTIELGESGVVFLLETSTGYLISKSSDEGDTVRADDDGVVQPVLASECGNDLIEAAVAELGDDLTQIGASSIKYNDPENGGMILTLRPVTDEYGLDWLIVGVAKESDFWGSSENSAIQALIVGITVTLVASFASVVLSVMITRPLKKLSTRMDRLSRLEGDVDAELETGYGAYGASQSAFQEVAVLQDAFSRMVRGVQSYIRFVPIEVVRHMMVNSTVASVGLAPGNVTVLFSDIANFTSISQQLDQVVLTKLLCEFFQAMSEAIAAHEGTIDKFIGDAVMAFWNGVSHVDDHAAKACRAAVDMQTRLDALRAKWVKQGLPEVHMRVGIATGDVMLGNVGSTSRLNYTLIGNTVNIAARLEGACKQVSALILIDSTVRKSIEGREAQFGKIVDHGGISVKGYEDDVHVYAIDIQ